MPTGEYCPYQAERTKRSAKNTCLTSPVGLRHTPITPCEHRGISGVRRCVTVTSTILCAACNPIMHFAIGRHNIATEILCRSLRKISSSLNVPYEARHWNRMTWPSRTCDLYHVAKLRGKCSVNQNVNPIHARILTKILSKIVYRSCIALMNHFTVDGRIYDGQQANDNVESSCCKFAVFRLLPATTIQPG